MTPDQTKRPKREMPLVPVFHTILAARTKTSELFVKSFQYQGENIATKHLGQVFGFFEIPDTQEENAYIVNFLASVVKKEYFVNPKRSASDSFEAALHKVNLALTELVKQGNTAWLGNLHGVVSVIAQNTFHFSVTGDASIILYRDQQATLISEGLADKDAALHPLKTFLEISSGALLPEDKLLLTSPELFTLCEPEILRKNAFRMEKNGFARFVRAALVNELPLGVSLVIDVEPEEAKSLPKKKAKELREASLEKLQNVFSGTSFQEEVAAGSNEDEPSEEASVGEEEVKDYIDQKTGHIYVQGAAPYGSYQEPSFWQNFREEQLLPLWKNFLASLKRLSKKSRKSVVKQAGFLKTESKELSKSLWEASKEKGKILVQKSRASLQSQASSRRKESEASISPEDSLSYDTPLLPTEDREVPVEKNIVFAEEEIPIKDERRALLHKFSPHYEAPPRKGLGERTKAAFGLSNVSAFLKGSSLKFGKEIIAFFRPAFFSLRNLSLLKKILLGLVFLFAVVLVAAYFSRDPKPPTEEAGQNANTPSSESISTETPLPPQLKDGATRASWTDGQALFVAQAENSTVTVTSRSVLLNEKSFPFPAEGTIVAATYMTDLRMVFLWSSRSELVSFSVVDQRFTSNTLPLPTNTTITSLGSYLTYLYVLDKNSGAIYRFARTEGGFSEATTWLKTPLAKESAQAFVVTDVIRIATAAGLDQYFKGAKEKTVSPTSYTILGLSSEKNFTLGLETVGGKLSIWNAEGNQVYEGTFEELKSVSALSYNESEKKLLITRDQNLREYPLSW